MNIEILLMNLELLDDIMPFRINRQLLERLVMWDDPIISSSVFCTGMIGLTALSYYPLMCVLSYLGLFLLGLSSGLQVLTYTSRTVLHKEINNPVESVATMDPSVSPQSVQRVIRSSVAPFNTVINRLHRLLILDDMVESLKFGLELWAVAYFGSLFSMMTILTVSWVSIFTLPKIYRTNQAKIDSAVQRIQQEVVRARARVCDLVPLGNLRLSFVCAVGF